MDIFIQNLTKKISLTLSPKRMSHSIGVSKAADDLALRYGADPVKARIAGLLHDCARELPSNTLLQYAKSFGILVTDVEQANPALLHGSVGAYLAHREYGVSDEEILGSIYWHTTGRSCMTVLEKIIFLADYIEENRHFPGVELLRRLAKTDLNKAVLAGYDMTLRHVIDQGGIIHTASIEGRNYLLLRGG